MRHIFSTTYKGKNRSKYICELYITNWSYSNKVGIVFAMYQVMISKGGSWAGPRHMNINWFSWIIFIHHCICYTNIGGNDSSQDSLNILVNYHYHSENRVITQ